MITDKKMKEYVDVACKAAFIYPWRDGNRENMQAALEAVFAMQPVKCHNWNNEPGTKTSPIKCLLCSDEAVVIVYAENGCTCAKNKYQPRCSQHLSRAYDSNEDIEIVEDFRIKVEPEDNQGWLINYGNPPSNLDKLDEVEVRYRYAGKGTKKGYVKDFEWWLDVYKFAFDDIIEYRVIKPNTVKPEKKTLLECVSENHYRNIDANERSLIAIISKYFEHLDQK